jgi:acetyltransferase-like isoleucine patch superfamily enzyme
MRIFNLKLLGADIGNNVKSYGRFTIMNAKNLTIGNNSTLNEGVHINCRDKVIIGQEVRISTNVQIHTGKLLINSYPRIHTNAPIIIEDNVWIASGCIISAGVKIGKNAVIGANSVVIENVEANCFYSGNPAKKINYIKPNKSKL